MSGWRGQEKGGIGPASGGVVVEMWGGARRQGAEKGGRFEAEKGVEMGAWGRGGGEGWCGAGCVGGGVGWERRGARRQSGGGWQVGEFVLAEFAFWTKREENRGVAGKMQAAGGASSQSCESSFTELNPERGIETTKRTLTGTANEMLHRTESRTRD